MSANNGFGGVAECYAFKSRLQEYAQKVGLTTPVYDTVMEGPSHEPVFQSTVTVNNVRYNSLPGFYNRKAAEQSAAEIALMEIHKSGQMTECIPTVHATGLCKNLLQEYAQKMNYAIPSYICNKLPSVKTPFSCTVEIGGIQYIGAAAKTKKEAEIKAARTALLAIQSSSCCDGTKNGVSSYTVLPGKKKGKEPEVQTETVKHIKPKKADFKKKGSKRRIPRKKGDNASSKNGMQGIANGEDASGMHSKDVKTLEADNSSQFAELGGSKVYPTEYVINNTLGDSDKKDECLRMLNAAENGFYQNARWMKLDNTGSNEESNVKGLNVMEIVNCVESQYGQIMENSLSMQTLLEDSGSGDFSRVIINPPVGNVMEATVTPQDV